MRMPNGLWEWVLLFSPAAVIWVATAAGSAVIVHPGVLVDVTEIGGVRGALIGLYIAIPPSFVAGFVLTKPNHKWLARTACSLSAAILVAVLNFGIAFAGCRLAEF